MDIGLRRELFVDDFLIDRTEGDIALHLHRPALQEVVLIHADPGDGLVDKGQPVAFWEGVGIALESASSTSDNIPIDTEGIWRLSVVATAQIYIGQVLFITNLGVITDTQVAAWGVIGYALQGISAAGTEIIAVKVHWMGVPWNLFWWDWWPQS